MLLVLIVGVKSASRPLCPGALTSETVPTLRGALGGKGKRPSENGWNESVSQRGRVVDVNRGWLA